MVVGGGGGDGVVFSFIAVPLRVYPVKGKGHNCQDVGTYGVVRPGGIDFAACYIFDIVAVADIIIRGGVITYRSIVHYNVFRNYDLA